MADDELEKSRYQTSNCEWNDFRKFRERMIEAIMEPTLKSVMNCDR